MSDNFSLEGFDDLFGTDPSTEQEGAWMDIPNKPGWRIRLRSSDTPLVRDAAARINRRHVPLYRVNKVPTAVELDKDKVDLLVKATVTGWEGFDGLACNAANIRRVMEAYPKFRDLCIQFSDQMENYRKAEAEELEGNSERPSEAS